MNTEEQLPPAPEQTSAASRNRTSRQRRTVSIEGQVVADSTVEVRKVGGRDTNVLVFRVASNDRMADGSEKTCYFSVSQFLNEGQVPQNHLKGDRIDVDGFLSISTYQHRQDNTPCFICKGGEKPDWARNQQGDILPAMNFTLDILATRVVNRTVQAANMMTRNPGKMSRASLQVPTGAATPPPTSDAVVPQVAGSTDEDLPF